MGYQRQLPGIGQFFGGICWADRLHIAYSPHLLRLPPGVIFITA
jgi:hypothetical protein